MKKSIYALLIVVSTQYAIEIVKDKDSILQALVSSHNGAFGKNNLYKELTNEELNLWYSAIKEAKNFVTARSSNALGVKDKDLMNALSTIETANLDLINTIKIIRAAGKSSTALNQNKSILERIKQTMISVQKNLNNAIFVLNKEEKTVAKNILVSMAMFVETTASKAIRDTANL